MADQIAENWRVERLLVPVGGNPLPIAVAAPLLIRAGGTVTLLFSNGTRLAAERLAVYLEKRGSVKVAPVLVSESDPHSIFTGAQKALEGEAGRIGVHYTAGTKAMSVQACRAAEALGHSDTVYSYLDPRADALVVHDADVAGGRVEQIPVGGVTIPLQNQIFLHGAKSLEGPEAFTNPQAPVRIDVAARLVEINAEQRGLVKPWTDWKNQWIDPKRGKPWDVTAPWDLEGCPWLVAQTLGPITQGARTVADAARLAGFADADALAAWAHGQWLEHYVQAALREGASETGFRDILRGMEIGQTVAGGAELFELDLLAVRGHRLYLFSCCLESSIRGASSRPKHKLFEAIYRARQIGGDEARVALVTCLTEEDAGVTQREAERLLRVNKRIRVFSRNELMDIGGAVTRWVKENG